MQLVVKLGVTIHHFTGVGGIMIQNNGKQDVFPTRFRRNSQGWIRFGAASLAPYVLNSAPRDGGEQNGNHWF
ncbi:MAG: hypothetical protein HN580_20250 [Deltaproteobacteria bacterium]|nr:hypothetical protein [Deltaproteobacteria bacterium]MBT4639142.1 hypothetical protein [Deltaproteobacteria bacterium]MBT6504749.1 hypothetical protein [Deltaproteobacteria bacterium]MBT7712738.1 hypothetical protein [Deltaproteobacteria bacterium]MBT7891361.1 hypothetical protein [Deltaproteobacteria bacterium]